MKRKIEKIASPQPEGHVWLGTSCTCHVLADGAWAESCKMADTAEKQGSGTLVEGEHSSRKSSL